MVVRGGDTRQLTINGREFEVAGDTGGNIMASGYNNENTPIGNGNVATVQKRKLGGFTDYILSINDTNKDVEFLQSIWDAGEAVPVTLTKASGQTYSGSLKGEGELIEDTALGQVTISMLGAKFEQI